MTSNSFEHFDALKKTECDTLAETALQLNYLD